MIAAMKPSVTVPALQLQHVSKRYGSRAVLHDVVLALAPGDLVALVGVNGAGKTTLLRCLLDFQRADGGQITIHGACSTTTQARQGLAYLPERFTPPAFLTGAEYLRLVAQLSGASVDQQPRDALLHALDFDPAWLADPVATYSKGTAQKLGLAGALLTASHLLVLDEPMSGLDPRARKRVREQLQAARDRGLTVLMTTHHLNDVVELDARMAVLSAGRIVFEGQIAQMLAAHAQEHVERGQPPAHVKDAGCAGQAQAEHAHTQPPVQTHADFRVEQAFLALLADPQHCA